MSTQPNREKLMLQQRVKNASSTLLIIAIVSAITAITILFDYMFYFSAALPWFIVIIAQVVGEATGNTAIALTLGVIFALAIAAMYAVFWYLANKKSGLFLIIGAAAFALDSIFVFVLFPFAPKELYVYLIATLVFHALAIFWVCRGIKPWRQMKNMPDTVEINDEEYTSASSEIQNDV